MPRQPSTRPSVGQICSCMKSNAAARTGCCILWLRRRPMAKGSFDATDLFAPLMLRIPLGLIFMAHGSQKLLGLFGGRCLTATFAIFEKDLGIPAIFTLLAIIAEFGS